MEERKRDKRKDEVAWKDEFSRTRDLYVVTMYILCGNENNAVKI